MGVLHCNSCWKNRMTLSHFSHLWIRRLWLTFMLLTIFFPFHLPFVSPLFQEAINSLMHASWLHYTPAKPSLRLSNPATHSAETSNAFILFWLLLAQAKPHREILASFQFFFISAHNMWVYEVQTKRESFKQNKHAFSCWQLQWLNTEHRVFCFSTCEVQTGCCLLSQKAIIPQTHDRLITYYTWLAGVFIQAKHLDSLQAESSKCVSVRTVIWCL